MEQFKYSFIILFIIIAAIVSYYLVAILLLVGIAYLGSKVVVTVKRGYNAVVKR